MSQADEAPTVLELRASTQRALLGVVSDKVVGIAISLRGRAPMLVVYTTAPLSPDEVEDFEVSVTEIHADFPVFRDGRVHVHVASSDVLESMGDGDTVWLLVRRGYHVRESTK